ncbi:MAG: hypothetical protein ACXWE9_01045 [Methylobacter sp.]
MDINKKNRSDLKSYFVKNSIPTESNFAELIDGMLNQKDDGIVKLSGDPLSIEAAGDSTGLQKVINFYAKFQDANPSWSLQLNPRIDPNTPSTAKTGFCVADGKGAARLFIDQATGNIGLGVVNPNGKLDVAGQVRIGFDEGGSGVRSISFARDAGDEGNAGKIAYRGSFGQDALHIVGAGAAGNPRKVKLWDNTEVTNLTALGAITPSNGNSVSNGILFKNNIGGDTTDSAWVRYYARSAELMTLEIGTANDDSDHIALMPSGNVGIGLNNPLYSFDVKAAKGIKLGLEGNGGGQLILKNNKDDNKIYVEAFSKDGAASAAELLLTGINGANVPKLSLLADVTNIAGNAGIGLAATATPIAKLDIAQAPRSGSTHPAAIKGLYITGEFGADADGVEFRLSNATQGIGFGYNTIYAAGSNANQDLQLKPKGTGALQLLGKVDISDGSNTGIVNNMANGSLAIGSTTVSYGGGNNWNSNTAGLMLQTLANTEIAVHDSGTRITSLMYYQGDAANKITIGRDMGWGLTPVAIAGDITFNGNVSFGCFTGADADEWPKFTWYRDTANNWDEGLIKHGSGRGFFGRAGYGIHLHSSRDWMFFSTGWDALFGIEGGTGNTKIKGNLTVNGSITCNNGIPLARTNYSIELSGSAFESSDGNITFLKVNDVAMDMTNIRGLNTTILNPNGTYKNKANHDVYANLAVWNTWADWVNANAAFGDIVAVASFDAISNAPRGGSADVLLSSILAEKAYIATTTNQRTPYTLIFMKGGVAMENASTYKGINARIKTVSYTLAVNRSQWRNAVLINSWVIFSSEYNPAQYFKDDNGVVWLRGLVKSGVVGQPIFVLPEGFRPTYRQLHVVCVNNNTVGRVDITPDGNVWSISGSNGWVSLDSIAFRSAPLAV